MEEVRGQYLSQGYITTLPHMQSKMGQWEDFVLDNNVWLVATWLQGMPTIGHEPYPVALHFLISDRLPKTSLPKE